MPRFTAIESVPLCSVESAEMTTGGTHFVEPDYDRSIEAILRKHMATHGSVNFDHMAIGRDELCSCCNGGRLLPTACFQGAA